MGRAHHLGVHLAGERLSESAAKGRRRERVAIREALERVVVTDGAGLELLAWFTDPREDYALVLSRKP